MISAHGFCSGEWILFRIVALLVPPFIVSYFRTRGIHNSKDKKFLSEKVRKRWIRLRGAIFPFYREMISLFYMNLS